MTRPSTSTRRQYLRTTALAAFAATAGCLGGGGPGQTGDADATTDPSNATDTAGTATPTDTATATSTPATTPPESLSDWLADANGYRGERRRFGPHERPTIAVGEPLDDGIAFAPQVVEVAPLTEVRWDWTGHGGQHNVVALDGSFDSGRTNAQAGTEYHVFFEEPGEYPFVSEPHREDGMKGVVVVAEPPSTGYPAVDEWLVDAGNFDGEVVDRTGRERATVTVGAEGNGGAFVFDPPALKVSTGTTVAWEWTGDGGGHNVAFEDADVRSGQVLPEPGVHFEHAFADAGSYRYACEPHRALGMKGAVIVE